MQRRSFLKSCAAVSLASAELPAAQAPANEALEAGFRNPPQSASPKTWWHWMSGNVTASGITADLEAMKRIGLGGFQIFNVNSRTPRGPVVFFSPEWFQLTEHAAKEADRLGLEFAMHNCPGWSSSAGPWITPEVAMQQLVWSETYVTGGKALDLPLAQPYTKLSYYRDAAVVAFPSLAGERRPIGEKIRAVTSSSGPVDAGMLTNGELSKTVAVSPAPSGEPGFLLFEFTEPIVMQSIALYGVSVGASGSSSAAEMAVEASDDGLKFRHVCEIRIPSTGGVTDIPGTESFPAVSLKYLRILMRLPARISQVRIASAARIAGWHFKNNSASRGGPGQATAAAPGFTADVPRDSVIDVASVVDLSKHMDAEGRLRWDAPAGDWTILRMGHTPTGRHNSSAPEGGAGLDCDKFSRAGIDFHFHKMFENVLPMLRPLIAKKMAGSLIDSYEVGMQNWTHEFPQVFQQRLGYGLTPYLPAMTGRIAGGAEISERFLWDVRRLQADLMADNYYGRFAELCRENGLFSAAEPYAGGPFDEMQIGSRVEVPMGEFWQGGSTHRSVKLASSVGHVNGKPVIGAESFTGNPEYSKWQEHPYGLKAQGDWMYAQGLNQFIFHRYALQPNLDAVPGMTMGCYGIHFDRTNTWFEQGREWIRYLSRCQYLLQQGLFVADLLYFEGEDAPVEAPTHSTLQPAPPEGLDWDAIDTAALLQRVRIENGRIVLPDGMSYRLLVLRDDARLTLDLARKIRDLVRQGMCLYGAKLQGSPSLMGYPASDAETRRIAEELWGTAGTASGKRKVGAGWVFWGQPLGAVLRTLEVAPDFEHTSRSGDAHVYYIHRRIGESDFYFLANHKRRSEDLVCTFRVEGKQPELWDPATGSVTPCPVYDSSSGRTRVPVHLDPAGSAFVVFRGQASPRRLVSVERDGAAIVSAQPFGAIQAGPNREVTNNFTISVWIKPELDSPLPPGGQASLAAPTSYVFFPPAGDLVYGEGHASCGMTAGRNGIAICERTRAGAATVISAKMGIAGWTHVAAVYRAGVPSLYVNGKLVQSGKKSARVVHPGFGEPNLGYGAPGFNGDMSQPQLFPEALDEDRVSKLVALGVPPPEEPSCLEPAGSAAGPEMMFWQDGGYLFRDASGKQSTLRLTGIGAPVNVTGPWEVTFPPKRGAPARVILPELLSLHRHSDPGVRYFSGTATYSRSLTLSGEGLGAGKRLYLDLGRVEVIAEVHIDGHSLGVLWKPPYRLDITDAVHSGSNKLDVLVTNLWPNRLIGDEFLPAENEYSEKGTNIKDIGQIKQIPAWFLANQPKPGPRVTFATWKHYNKDSPLLESGLLGPVRLRFAVRQPLSKIVP